MLFEVRGDLSIIVDYRVFLKKLAVQILINF